jgi:hypothetical protein
VQSVLDEVSITLNKNSVPGDKSAMTPGGMRIGTPALTTRGFKEADFVAVADFIDRAVKIAQDCQKQTPAPGERDAEEEEEEEEGGVLFCAWGGREGGGLHVRCDQHKQEKNSSLPSPPLTAQSLTRAALLTNKKTNKQTHTHKNKKASSRSSRPTSAGRAPRAPTSRSCAARSRRSPAASRCPGCE